MAAPDSTNILVASPVGAGGVLTADLGTALPTSASASTSAFTATGYIGEDGVTMTVERETEDLFAWGGSKVRVIQTSHSVQLQVPFLEVNPETLALTFGADNVNTVGNTSTIKVNGAVLPHFALVLDMLDGDKKARLTAADAQVVAQEDIVFVHTAAATLELTIELFPDSAGDNATIYYEGEPEGS